MTYNGEDMCYNCRETVKKEKEASEGKTANPQQGSSTTATKNGTSSTPAQTALIKYAGAGKDPLAAALTLDEAMDLFKVGGLTKTDMSKYRKLSTQFKRAVSDKRRSKLTKRILELSQKICHATTQVTVHG